MKFSAGSRAMMLFIHLMIGTVMIALTVGLHAIALDLIMRNLHRIESIIRHVRIHAWKSAAIATVVLAIFFVHVIEIWAWAALYLMLGALPDLETALYFSTTAFTTVGFGDVISIKDWRILGAVEAANGFMLFGWSTAFTMEIMFMVFPRIRKTDGG